MYNLKLLSKVEKDWICDNCAPWLLPHSNPGTPRGRKGKGKGNGSHDTTPNGSPPKPSPKKKPRGRSKSAGKRPAGPCDNVTEKQKKYNDFRPRWGGKVACINFMLGKECGCEGKYAHVTKEEFDIENAKMTALKKQHKKVNANPAVMDDDE